VLGAIVSPPDPVAATAVARRLRLPDRLVTILEGEGMFNDATALVAFKVAVAATVTGHLSGTGTAVELVVAIAVGVGVGLLSGWVTKVVLAAIQEPNAETTATVLIPFVAYVGAERLGGSGVLAVLFLGLFLRSQGHSATTSRGWLLGRSVWSYADFLITSLVFALLGYELVKVIGSTEEHGHTLQLVSLVVATLVVFRAGWVFAAAWISGLRARRRDYPAPVGWRETTVVAWAGMRGVVTVATALALPATTEDGGAFPRRDEIVVVALACVLLTLVAQGLTLGPLAGRLGVADQDEEGDELSQLRRRAAQAALEQVRSEPTGEAPGDLAEEVRRAAILQYEGYIAAQTAMAQARRTDLDGDRDAADQLDRVLARASAVERELVLEARTRGEVGAAAADEVLRDIEARALRDFG
jgi:CPA1 family monovalent cation:H+ antiporter